MVMSVRYWVWSQVSDTGCGHKRGILGVVMSVRYWVWSQVWDTGCGHKRGILGVVMSEILGVVTSVRY